MIPASFEYAAPASLQEAIALLQQHGDEAKLLAGGHSLLPLMKLRLAVPGILVDLGRLPDLRYIEDRGDHIAIGALTTHFMLESSKLLAQRVPLLADAASMIGDMQVRNRGTIGGSLVHADPAADMGTVITALNADIVAAGATGERVIPVADFFLDIWTTDLEPDEVVTEVRIPAASQVPDQNYQKFRQRAADWALVGVAVSLRRQNGTIGDAAVVLTNVGTTPIRARSVEDALRGQPATEDVVREAAAHAADGLDPAPELKASPDYKRHLARVLTRRALTAALHAG